MFKYTLAATLDEMDREGITVAECPLRSMRCLSLQNGRIVGINTARFDSSAEVRTALIHEDGILPAARSTCRIRPTSSKRRRNTGPTKPPCSSTSPTPNLPPACAAATPLPTLPNTFA